MIRSGLIRIIERNFHKKKNDHQIFNPQKEVFDAGF